MSGFLNEATLIGNLGQDPEARTMHNGGKVVTLSVATNESWTDSESGERKQRTEWHRVAIFNSGLADIAEKYLVKGAKVLVRGSLRTRKWLAQDGSDRYSTEIHLPPYNGTLTFLSGRRDSDRVAGGNAAPQQRGDYDEEVPF